MTELRHLPRLEDENQRLQKLVANLSLSKEMSQEVLKQKFGAVHQATQTTYSHMLAGKTITLVVDN